MLRGVCGYGPKRDLTFDRLNYKTIGNLAVRKRLVESVFEWRPIVAKQLVQIITQDPHFVVAETSVKGRMLLELDVVM